MIFAAHIFVGLYSALICARPNTLLRAPSDQSSFKNCGRLERFHCLPTSTGFHCFSWCNVDRALSDECYQPEMEPGLQVTGHRVTGSVILAGSDRVTGQCVRPGV